MIWLILGVLLWAFSHLMKRVTPGFRAGLGDARAKGLATLLSLLAIAMMIWGYGQADYIALWDPPAFLRHVNNLLMLVAVFLVMIGYVPGVLRTKMRHPMLAAVKTWALAHLLVNGDLASLILFGGILAWAVVNLILTNRMNPEWTRPHAGPVRNDLIWALGSVLVLGGVGWIHGWLGYPVFGV
jgi:uncharacterized membrane protein